MVSSVQCKGWVQPALLRAFRRTTCSFASATTSMKYNSHAIQFPHLQCTMQWFLVQVVQPSLQLILEHFITPRRNTICSGSNSPLRTSPSPWQPPIHFTSLWICLVWACHINGIVLHVAFCDLPCFIQWSQPFPIWTTTLVIRQYRYRH